MSTNTDDEKDTPKAVPLDLARNISSVRTVEGKTPIVMTNQSLRGMRVLTQSVPGSNPSSLGGSTIIATNLVSQAVLKTDSNRPQITGIITSNTSQPQVTSNLSRPTQITLSAPSQTIGTSYHVPRGPAVVANLAAPRSNVTTVRTPMVVAQGGQPHTFVRPPRSSSPASGTAWLTNSSTGSQIKGAPTVLSSPVRGATVTGKPAVISRTQPQGVSTIRPGTILQNAISIGQTGQIHSFKAGSTGIQALGNTVTIAQVLPSRTQAVVYSANSNAHFTPARITVATTTTAPRLNQPRNQVTTTRLTVPVNVSQSGTRLITPQATVLSSGARISAVTTAQTSTTARIVTTQPNLSIGRLSVATATPTAVTNATFIGPTKLSTLNLHSLVAVANANAPPARTTISTQGPKVITQPAQGTIQLTGTLSAQLKTTPSNVSTGTRTISVPAAIVTQQRQATLVPSQAISIAKVFPQNENPVTGSAPTNVFIHTPVQSTRHSSPSPNPSNCITQTSSAIPTTTVATYSLTSGAYFYDNAPNAYSMQNRNFTQQQQQQQGFSSLNQNTQPLIRPSLNTQVHGIVSNQQMRFNSVMVLEQNRSSPQIQQSQLSEQPSAQQITEQIQQQMYPKITSSPRPSILRKRDHEGSPLKAAKNLVPILSNLSSQQPQLGAQAQSLPPASPPSRPDSRGNGHSSGGSTTISATSSPGLAEINDDSNHAIINNKEEEETKPPMEMSPRKKPRKQQLTGNDLDENKDDMQFISDQHPIKKEEDSDVNQSDEPKDGAPEAGQVTTVRKPASASLLNSYRQNWKATHNHYLRHTDVKPKDERRPTIMDLANQYRVQDKVNGWKIHHLSTQMEDLADQEQTVYNQLTELLKCTESEEGCKQFNKEINRINELIKGNLQRIKIINDGMVEAKSSIMKIFDHKVHVTDIINRCASKRNFKKREKS